MIAAVSVDKIPVIAQFLSRDTGIAADGSASAGSAGAEPPPLLLAGG